MTHTHVIHRHLQTHTNTFNLQSEMYTHTHTHILARLGSCRNWSDGFWLIVCKCWNIINPFFFAIWNGACACTSECVCVCERLFQADGGSRGPFCRVNREKLTSTDCCISSSPPFLSFPLFSPPFIPLNQPQRPPTSYLHTPFLFLSLLCLA